MNIKYLFTLIYLLSLSVFAQNNAEYNSLELNQIPFNIRNSIISSMKELELKPAFVGNRGSELLKINLLFTDPFFTEKIAIKYKVSGKFDLNRFYNINQNEVYHLNIGQDTIAIFFNNVSDIKKKKIIFGLKNIKVSQASFSIIDKAYASEVCFAPDLYPQFNVDTQISENTNGSLLSNCMSGLVSGVEESTVGVVTGIWDGLKSEYNKIVSDPGKRFGEYWNYVDKGISTLWDFTKTLSKMIVDPVYGMQVLKTKFGEMGVFFSEVYQGIVDMPNSQKLEVICNILGSIGVDALIAALTVGAGSGKLALTVTRLLSKLKKVSKLIGRGFKLPFKALEQFSDKVLLKMEKILNSPNKKLLDDKIKGLGCAI